MKMKEVCSRTGLTERTVRFYAGEGLISPASSEMNERTYFDFSEDDIKCLMNIAILRRTGFSVEQILNMQKKPSKITNTVETLRQELKKQKEETDKSLTALNGVKEENINDIGSLAGMLKNSSETKRLPAIDLEPDFGRFEIITGEEKSKAYSDFLINSGRRSKRKTVLCLLSIVVLTVAVSVFVTLLITGQFKGRDRGNYDSMADCLVGEYKEGDVEITFMNEDYSMTAEGIHGGTLRPTRVYSGGGKELSISWSYFSEPENQLVIQIKQKTGAFKIERGLGKAVVMAILPSDTEGNYFAVYAESDYMTAEELLRTVRGNVSVRCSWSKEYAL